MSLPLKRRLLEYDRRRYRRGIVEGFMGHVFGLDQSYLLKTDDELRERVWTLGHPVFAGFGRSGSGSDGSLKSVSA
jgi:hypothetical protein